MEREASGQGGCCGLIEVFGRSTADLPFRASASTTADIFVSRPRLAPRLDRVSPYQCAPAQISLVGRRSAEPLSAPETPVRLGPNRRQFRRGSEPRCLDRCQPVSVQLTPVHRRSPASATPTTHDTSLASDSPAIARCKDAHRHLET